MPETTPDSVNRRLAEMRSVADLDERAGAPVGEALRCAVRAVEAAPRVAGNFEPPLGAEGRDDFAAGAAAGLEIAKEQIYGAMTEALTGRTEGGGDG